MAITAGQTIHASDLNALGLLGSILSVDSVSVNNSTVLVSTAISIALAANSLYSIQGWVWANASAPPDVKLGWLVPAGATGQWSILGPYVGATPVAANKRINYVDHSVLSIATSQQFGGDTTVAQSACQPKGYISTSVTAGNLVLQFAQVNATAVNTNIKAGSHIMVAKLA